ncbi:uncharacterized protein AMSG_11984 [Thecamonas trahens ATCC 50062]|uniref:Rap-GAP domain-containing protein n=1 Tax=Thecamonas trahens ATCC 50062 TaxID=461836 RepID=A0A0L0DFS0_THETB|nr:hypothetical protein AMSG_11984 [Thecamonas trahens ATCC 50062]KNC51139.1 hypothetical protein AMSG_11984 [Thecamonas trahens ATCC 50062]|eukprot:XP_013756435.1 hypothetical protein AMSG_11984 [Thecamonas trahens ATCC 50062]
MHVCGSTVTLVPLHHKAETAMCVDLREYHVMPHDAAGAPVDSAGFMLRHPQNQNGDVLLSGRSEDEAKEWIRVLAAAPNQDQPPRITTEAPAEGAATPRSPQTSSLLLPLPGWVLDAASHYPADANVLLENNKLSLAWYRLHFAQTSHANFLGENVNEKGEHVVISVMRSGERRIRAIVWTTASVTPLEIATTKKFKSFKRDLKTVLLEFDPQGLGKKHSKFRNVTGSRVANALVRIEDALFPRQLAVTVLFARADQQYSSQILGNSVVLDSSNEDVDAQGDQTGSSDGIAAFKDFLSLLGTEVELNGWDGYAGQLDTSAAARTGKTSYFTTVGATDIMFHVAPLIPGSQIRRAVRLKANIAAIVFLESANTSVQLDLIMSSRTCTILAVAPSPSVPGAYICQTARRREATGHSCLPSATAYPAGHPSLAGALLASLVNGIHSALRRFPVLVRELSNVRRAVYESLVMAVSTSSPGFELGPSSGNPVDVASMRVLAPIIGANKSGARGRADDACRFVQNVRITGWDIWDNMVYFADVRGLHTHNVLQSVSASRTLVSGAISSFRIVRSLGVVIFRGGVGKRAAKTSIQYAYLSSIGPAVTHTLDKTKSATCFDMLVTKGGTAMLAVAVKSTIRIFEWVHGLFVLSTTLKLEQRPIRVSFFSSGRLSLVLPSGFIVIHPVTGKYCKLLAEPQAEDEIAIGDNAQTTELDLDEPSSHVLITSRFSSVLIDADSGRSAHSIMPHISWIRAPHRIATLGPHVIGISGASIEVRLACSGAFMQATDLPQPIVALVSTGDSLFLASASGKTKSATVYQVYLAPTLLPIATRLAPDVAGLIDHICIDSVIA